MTRRAIYLMLILVSIGTLRSQTVDTEFFETKIRQYVSATTTDPQQATARLVDELLESPHYGQRWGRHWLDVARFSDGYGGFLDSDVNSDAWRYRDWVVAAFNDDMPYDKFIKLQIASDLSRWTPHAQVLLSANEFMYVRQTNPW